MPTTGRWGRILVERAVRKHVIDRKPYRYYGITKRGWSRCFCEHTKPRPNYIRWRSRLSQTLATLFIRVRM